MLRQRAATLVRPMITEVQEIVVREPAEDQVRVRLQGSGICASNLPVWEGRPWFNYPQDAGSPGHEAWGFVDAVGSGVRQKPLATNLADVERVVAAACHADRLLGIDFCYRHVSGMHELGRRLQAGAIVRLACSWHAHIGQGAIIQIAIAGTRGGAHWNNIDGSFYDFQLDLIHGTNRERLSGRDESDDWGPRALRAWVEQLRISNRFDSEANDIIRSAALIEEVYRA